MGAAQSIFPEEFLAVTLRKELWESSGQKRNGTYSGYVRNLENTKKYKWKLQIKKQPITRA